MKLFRLSLLFSFLLVGCGRTPTPDDLPPLHPVTLTITQNGAPLAGANVLLFAVSGEDKWAPGGVTDSAGIVLPKSQGRYAGAPVGKYKVCVSKSEIEKLSPGDSDAGKRAKAFKLVEDQYGNPETTPLEFEVVAGKNTATLDAGKAVRIALPTDGP